MRKATKSPGETIVKDIKRATSMCYSSDEKIRIVLDGPRGEDSIAELCRREGISQGLSYNWSKHFVETGMKRPAGDTARAANTDEFKALLREAKDLKDWHNWPGSAGLWPFTSAVQMRAAFVQSLGRGIALYVSEWELRRICEGPRRRLPFV